jgi:hypothetical protein
VTLTTEWVTATGAAVTVRFGGTGGVPTDPPALTVSTDQPSYTRSQTVTITAKVTSGGTPVANTAVSFRVTKSNGTVVTGSATTGANGTAVYKLRLKRQDPVGVYQAGAVATQNAVSVSASSNFTVQ